MRGAKYRHWCQHCSCYHMVHEADIRVDGSQSQLARLTIAKDAEARRKTEARIKTEAKLRILIAKAYNEVAFADLCGELDIGKTTLIRIGEKMKLENKSFTFEEIEQAVQEYKKEKKEKKEKQ